ncbi:MAG: hypothetical protein ACRC67_16595 [Inquilinus sp.]|uniref:hypothetical protein n=1 Tax=Inquilinus sp. TaxID=1932117 RepID=UPI003F3F64BA
MPHRILPLPFKPPRRDGLSERLLASPDETMYGAAVRRLNVIEARLKGLDRPGRPRRRHIAARFDAAIIWAVRDLAGAVSQRHRRRDAGALPDPARRLLSLVRPTAKRSPQPAA